MQSSENQAGLRAAGLRAQNYIAGELRDPAGGCYLDNIEPATGEVYSQVADSTADDVASAVEAARDAFPQWSHTPTAQRSGILLRIADLTKRRGQVERAGPGPAAWQATQGSGLPRPSAQLLPDWHRIPRA